jgi:hypothetical protein
MNKRDKNKILKRLHKAEGLIRAGESDLGVLSDIIQPLFEREVLVTWSTDGAIVTDEDGELGFFIHFLNDL